ncbi:ribokinase [Leptothrix discophora]|uniref:Ribokinase n=1 Tax=Leptothrix discophora TaxID=89 RepID=A0ABT9G481_LEPDI|nr:ribokinase [Leptothrix discophora]MDP4301279.1 ribokinase [Leptothrix discophora]
MSHPPCDVVCLASWNADLVSRVPRPLARGETLMASAFEVSPGGKGSNASVAAARQGARVAVLARIGADDFGRMALDLWQREGIDTAQVEVVEGERSGVAQIWVYDGGDNSIAVFAGAGAGLGPRHVEAAASTLAAARVVMAPCEVPIEATQAAFALARQHGVTTLLNPAPARPLPDALLALCDLLTPNEGELLALAGLGEDAPLETAAQALLARGAGAVMVTCGADGVRLFRPGQPALHEPGWSVDVIDTIGAGDTCTGALAAALARGLALPEAMRQANAAAALAVTGRGAIVAMPDRDGVSALLATRPTA